MLQYQAPRWGRCDQSERIVDNAECVAEDCAQLCFAHAEAQASSIVEAAVVQARYRHVLRCLQRDAARDSSRFCWTQLGTRGV